MNNWQKLGAVGPAAVAIVGLLAAVLTYKGVRDTLGQQRTALTQTLEQQRVGAEAGVAQQREAASREQWWKRAQWAMDLTQSGVESKKALGLAVLTYLGTSELAGADEAAMLEPAWVPILGDDDTRDSNAGDLQGGA
ncbi:hypothetical protein [Angustibacter aerolatus]